MPDRLQQSELEYYLSLLVGPSGQPGGSTGEEDLSEFLVDDDGEA